MIKDIKFARTLHKKGLNWAKLAIYNSEFVYFYDDIEKGRSWKRSMPQGKFAKLKDILHQKIYSKYYWNIFDMKNLLLRESNKDFIFTIKIYKKWLSKIRSKEILRSKNILKSKSFSEKEAIKTMNLKFEIVRILFCQFDELSCLYNFLEKAQNLYKYSNISRWKRF